MGAVTVMGGLGVFTAASTGIGKAAAMSQVAMGVVNTVGHIGAVVLGGIAAVGGWKMAVPTKNPEP